MNYYGAKDLAAAFRTVRNNTLKIAEEIPEDKYSFRPAEGSRSVGELLCHVAFGSKFAEAIHFVDRRDSFEGFDYMAFMAPILAEPLKPRSKAELIDLLQSEGERFAKHLESASEDLLGQSLQMPPGAIPSSRTRFDMLASVKEHEMHHRGQLMLMERMLGITPHLTRENEARRAAMLARQQQTA